MKEEDIDLGPNFASYCRVYNDFEKNGLSSFDELGRYAGYDGQAIIEQILSRFEELQMYKDCAFLRDFIIIYKEHFKVSSK